MSNKEIKGNLARLLATENLVVEHRSVPTASFNVDTRVLTLPNWDKASSIVYDMLVGHEVGHALFTPNLDPREFKAPKSYVNVVEDVRIEKLMKRKYPGLRKSFNGGYSELNALDFFEIEDEDLTKFSLVDRINLHAKVGAAALIPFKDDEKVFVTRAENTETFEEVLSLAEDIQVFVDAQKEAEEQIQQAPLPSNGTGGGEEDGEGEEEIEEDYQSSAQPNSSPQQEDPADLDTPSFSEGAGEHNDGETQEKFDRKTRDLSSNNYGREVTYIEIPEKVNLDKFIVDWKVVHEWIEEQQHENEKCGEWDDRSSYTEVDAEYQTFRNENKKEVNYLVKEFEMKKSADAYARSSTARTGVLDTKNLHTYKYNEDLFKRINIVPDGKNHGMIFVLDWSGSMQYEIFATVKQLLNLTAFCKKVQIPFEVYAFTNEWQIAQRAIDNGSEEIDYYPGWYGNARGDDRGLVRHQIHLNEGGFHLVNFISSRSNPRDYERQCKNFFRESYSFYHRTTYTYTPGLSLSGTPLNEAIVLLNHIIPQFKKDNDLQKVNACILTDGEANSINYGSLVEREDHEDYITSRSLDYGYCQLRDRKTGRVYSKMDGWNNSTTTFIQQVRDRNPGVNVIGFRLLPAKRLSEFVARFATHAHYEEVQKQWRKQKSAILPEPKGYSALYAISSKDLEDDSEFEVEESATKAQITRAFKKMLKSKSTNKKLLTSFVDQIA